MWWALAGCVHTPPAPLPEPALEIHLVAEPPDAHGASVACVLSPEGGKVLRGVLTVRNDGPADVMVMGTGFTMPGPLADDPGTRLLLHGAGRPGHHYWNEPNFQAAS